jgi:hypothetical protein
MAFTNERDKKGRLSYVYNSEDSAETIREIVEDCQKKVVGEYRPPLPSPCAPRSPRAHRRPRQRVHLLLCWRSLPACSLGVRVRLSAVPPPVPTTLP